MRTSSSRTAACGSDSSSRPASRGTSAAIGSPSTSSNRSSRRNTQPNNPSSTTHRQDREPLVLPFLFLPSKGGDRPPRKASRPPVDKGANVPSSDEAAGPLRNETIDNFLLYGGLGWSGSPWTLSRGRTCSGRS